MPQLTTEDYLTLHERITTYGFENGVIYINLRKTCIHTHTQPFYSPFSGTTRVSQCWKKSASGLYGAREDNSGRHTDHPAGRHCIWTSQRPPPSSPHFTGGMPFLPPSQPCQSTEGTGNGKLIFTENKITSKEKKSSI